jgi:hypothetical protein
MVPKKYAVSLLRSKDDMDFQTANEIFNVYSRYPKDGKTDGYMIGRFMVENENLRILEDHTGLLRKALKNGPVGHNAAALKSMAQSPYLKLVSESEVAQGHHVDLVPEGKEPSASAPQPQSPPDEVVPSQSTKGNFSLSTPPALFDYITAGMREPQVIEVKGEDVFMNGNKLSKEAVDRILHSVRMRLGKLKYRKAT